MWLTRRSRQEHFKIFSYPLLRGMGRGIFGRPREAVLTETMARTYFNTLDVVGKTIKIPRPNGDPGSVYLLLGVAALVLLGIHRGSTGMRA